MKVFVKNLRNEPLMPCKPSKARKLLKVGRAKIIDYKPFTIQLLYPTGKATQPIDIGIDLGAKHIGIAIQSQNKVLPSSKLCNVCGEINPMLTLNIREWQCPKCGTIHDRDKNASLNILTEGLRLLTT